MSHEIERHQQPTSRDVRLTRRHFLGLMAATGASLAGLLAACGGGDNTSKATATGAPAQATATTGAAQPTATTAAAQATATTGTAPSTSSPQASPQTGAQTVTDTKMGQAPAPADAKKGGTLIVANEADMNEGDPQKYSGTHAGRTLRNIFDPLVTIYDDSSDLRGGLASGWEISADGLT